MRILKKVRKMFCLYWSPVHTGTETAYSSPVECRCRWDEKSSVIRLRKGGEYISGTTVLMDRLVEEDGFLCLGTLAEVQAENGSTSINDPRDLPKAKIIKKTETVPTMRCKSYSDMNRIAHWAYL